MTLSEFKAWFEGFTEDMGERPTAKQWERIQARVGEITGHAVTYPVYIDRYVGANRPYWYAYNGVLPYAQAVSGNLCQSQSNMALQSAGNATAAATSFDSHAAMAALGRADAQALAQA